MGKLSPLATGFYYIQYPVHQLSFTMLAQMLPAIFSFKKPMDSVPLAVCQVAWIPHLFTPYMFLLIISEALGFS